MEDFASLFITHNKPTNQAKMGATVKYTFADANEILGKKGLRVSKVEFLRNVNNSIYKWAVFKKGRNPQTLLAEEVFCFCNSLEDAVKAEPCNYLTIGDCDLTLSFDPPEGADLPEGDTKILALAKLLRNMVPPGLSEAQIRKIIDKAVNKAIDAKAQVKIIEIPEGTPLEAIKGQHTNFSILLSELAMGHSVALSGPAGSGKTTAVILAAERLGMTVHIQASMDDAFDLLGFRDAHGNYQPTPAYRWATDQNPKGALLIFDEMDRADPRALCAAHAMMANGLVNFPHETVKVPPQHRVIATMNTWGSGSTGQYVGAAKLDGATLNRFPTRMVWDYDLNLEIEILKAHVGPKFHELATTIAMWSGKLRDRLQEQGVFVIWSPRDSMALVKRLASGTGWQEAIDRSVLATLDKGPRERVLKAVGNLP